jgi:hypothetical protein
MSSQIILDATNAEPTAFQQWHAGEQQLFLAFKPFRLPSTNRLKVSVNCLQE